MTDAFSTVMDLMPTILDLAGAPRPGKQFQGREVLPIRGTSWKDWLDGKATEIHGEDVPIGWELHGRAAMRIGDWKILFLRAAVACTRH